MIRICACTVVVVAWFGCVDGGSDDGATNGGGKADGSDSDGLHTVEVERFDCSAIGESNDAPLEFSIDVHSPQRFQSQLRVGDGSFAVRTGVTVTTNGPTEYSFRGEVRARGELFTKLDLLVATGRVAYGPLSGEGARLDAFCSVTLSDVGRPQEGDACRLDRIDCADGLYCKRTQSTLRAGSCTRIDELGPAAASAMAARVRDRFELPIELGLLGVVVDNELRRYEVAFAFDARRTAHLHVGDDGAIADTIVRVVPQDVIDGRPPWGNVNTVALGDLVLTMNATASIPDLLGTTDYSIVEELPAQAPGQRSVWLRVAPFGEIELALALQGRPGVIEAWPNPVRDLSHRGELPLFVQLGSFRR
jgi:hypothetical protein